MHNYTRFVGLFVLSGAVGCGEQTSCLDNDTQCDSVEQDAGAVTAEGPGEDTEDDASDAGARPRPGAGSESSCASAPGTALSGAACAASDGPDATAEADDAGADQPRYCDSPDGLVQRSRAPYPSVDGRSLSSVLMPLSANRGAWLATLHAPPQGSRAGSLHFRQVNAEGQVLREHETALNDVLSFRAASDGTWIALLTVSERDDLGRDLPTNGHAVKVLLLKADTLELVSTLLLRTQAEVHPSSDAAPDACDRLWVSDIAIRDTKTGLRLAAVFGAADGVASSTQPGICEAAESEQLGSVLYPLTYAGGSWTEHTVVPLSKVKAGQELGEPATFDSVEPMPCRDEWLVRYGASPDQQVLRRVPFSGAGGVDFYQLDDGNHSAEFFLGETDCTQPSTSLLLLHTDENRKSHSDLREFAVLHENGSLRDLGKRVRTDSVVLQAVESGGRWFAAGLTAGMPAAARLHELSLDEGSTREISLNVNSESRTAFGALAKDPPLAIAASNGGLILATSTGSSPAVAGHVHVLECALNPWI